MTAKNGRLSMLRPGNGIGWILSSGACSSDGCVVMSTSRVWPLRGDVLLGAVVAEAHLLERRELDLEELDRHPRMVIEDLVTIAAASSDIASIGSSLGA